MRNLSKISNFSKKLSFLTFKYPFFLGAFSAAWSMNFGIKYLKDNGFDCTFGFYNQTVGIG